MNTQPLTQPATDAGTDRILKGNADIAVSERGTARPDTRSCTLPIYPLQRDLPQLSHTGGAA